MPAVRYALYPPLLTRLMSMRSKQRATYLTTVCSAVTCNDEKAIIALQRSKRDDKASGSTCDLTLLITSHLLRWTLEVDISISAYIHLDHQASIGDCQCPDCVLHESPTALREIGTVASSLCFVEAGVYPPCSL